MKDILPDRPYGSADRRHMPEDDEPEQFALEDDELEQFALEDDELEQFALERGGEDSRDLQDVLYSDAYATDEQLSGVDAGVLMRPPGEWPRRFVRLGIAGLFLTAALVAVVMLQRGLLAPRLELAAPVPSVELPAPSAVISEIDPPAIPKTDGSTPPEIGRALPPVIGRATIPEIGKSLPAPPPVKAVAPRTSLAPDNVRKPAIPNLGKPASQSAHVENEPPLAASTVRMATIVPPAAASPASSTAVEQTRILPDVNQVRAATPTPPPAPSPAGRAAAPVAPPIALTPPPAAVVPRTEVAVAAPPGSPTRELDGRLINGALARYRAAFDALDAGAAAKVWPTVDKRTLTRAFERLKRQQVAFDDCQIDVKDARAQAVCTGTAWYVPRIGSSSAQVNRRQWKFNLAKVSDEWLIQSVDAR